MGYTNNQSSPGYDWSRYYSKDFDKGGTTLQGDLLELDTLRSSYDQQRQSEYAAFESDNKQYSKALTEDYNPSVKDIFSGQGAQTRTTYEFTGSGQLQALGNRISALEYYDEKMPEAAKTRQAQRDLEESKAKIAARKADEAKRRDELRRLRLAPKDVNTTQQGELGG